MKPYLRFLRTTSKLVSLLVILVMPATGDVRGATFQAGASAVDITPTNFPIRTAGNLTLTSVDQVRDPLHARALVLDDGKLQLAIATVDSCMVSREDLDEAKALASRATGIAMEHILISSTHSHTAPAVYGCHGNDAEPAYRAFLIPRIAESIIQAWRKRAPARAGWGRFDLPEYVHCRRWIMQPGTATHLNPAFTGLATNLAMMNPGHANTNRIRQTGPSDPAVTVLSIQTRAGAPLGLLANYSSHYGGAPSHQISADYFGEFCALLAKELCPTNLNSDFVALMNNGTSGDANWIDLSQPGKKYSPTLIATDVTQAALQILKDLRYHDTLPMAMAEQRLTLKVRLPTPQQVMEAKQYLELKVGDRPTRSWEENYARETTLMANWPSTVEIKLQAIRIGDLGMAAIPCEVYGSTGLAIKQHSPFKPTMVISLANGCSGYLPPPDQFSLGGYTTWRARTSFLETDAEPKITAEIDSLLKQIFSHRESKL